MNINYKEAQFEFFPNTSAGSQDAERPRVLAAQLTLSGENLVILAITGIMFLLLSFSFGVERGKRVVSVQQTGVAGAEVKVSTANVTDEASIKDVAPRGKSDKSQDSALRAAVDLKIPSPTGSFTVQVASYKSEKKAGKEADNLKQKGYRDVYVVPKGAYVIVCVGSFSSQSDAKAYTSKLKNRYQDTVVRRL